MKTEEYSNGLSFSNALFLLFLALKLTGYVSWSWWWITAPLWIPFILTVITLIILILSEN